MTRWLEIAWSEEGVAEVAGGARANPRIVQMFADAGRVDVTSDEIAWCGAFAAACLSRSGVSLAAIPKPERLMARSYLKIGTPIDDPRIGCIAVFTRGDPTAATGHVGFVVGSTPTHLAILGGNQSNKVCVAHYPRARLLGLRWPAPAVTTQQLERAGSRTAVAAKAQTHDAGKAGGPQLVPAPPSIDMPAPEAVVGQATAMQGTIEQAISFSNFASAKWPWLMAAVTLYFLARMAWRSGMIRGWRAEDASTGAHVGRDTLPVVRSPLEATDAQLV